MTVIGQSWNELVELIKRVRFGAKGTPPEIIEIQTKPLAKR